MHNKETYYHYNFLANKYFKIVVCSFGRDIIYYKIKSLVNNINIKLPAKKVSSKTLEWFSLNNIKKLLYKVAKFTKFLIKTAIKIVADTFGINFMPSDLTDNNQSINVVVQLGDNTSNNKSTYTSNNSQSSSNDNNS